MAVTAPQQMNPNTLRSGVHWTRFPADSLSDVDWSDHRQSHRGVMRLFPRHLDGPRSEKRDAAGILYRLDSIGGTPIVLVQSQVTPEMVPPIAQTMEVAYRSWTFEPGDQVAFRVAVNAVRRVSTSYTDDTRRTQLDGHDAAQRRRAGQGRAPRRQTALSVDPDDVPAWLVARLAGVLEEVAVIHHFRDVTAAASHKVVVDTLDAVGVVTDSDAFATLRRTGVGRSKSYGCGLLTAHHVMT